MEPYLSEPSSSPLEQERNLFQKYYPEGNINIADYENLPDEVKGFFQNKAVQFTDQKEVPADFFKYVRVIAHENQDITYCSSFEKTLSTNGEHDRCIVVIDFDPSGELIGYGEVVNNLSEDIGSSYSNEPFVGYVQTEEKYQRQGKALRRYIVMNALTQMINHRPLHSPSSRMPEATAVWEKLVQMGKAKKTPSDLGYDSYVFQS